MINPFRITWLVAALVVGVPAVFGTPTSDSSVETVCQRHPERVASLFSALNLDYPGLEQVKAAAEKKDWPAACRGLLHYYRNGTTASWLRHEPVPPSDRTDPAAAPMLEDTYTFYNVTATVPRLANGLRNWDYRGPDPVLGHEWTSYLNRQSYLAYLLGSYFANGNAVYARYINDCLRDWVLANTMPKDEVYICPWSAINVGLRVQQWPGLFYGLQQTDAFSDAARILVLSSVLEQAQWLRTKHSPDTNHLLMEMTGLAAIAVAWPEFAEADRWRQYAQQKMVEQLAAVVYPDGVHNELTDCYHQVAAGQFEKFAEILHSAGYQTNPAFEQTIEKMWNYVTYVMQPSGFGPNNNESDQHDNRPHALHYAKTFGRPDWTYMATSGREGQKPAGLPSVVFPWAGQVVMRSGWEDQAQWAFFDIGPAGFCHENRDKLHLSVSALGHEWLVDSGRYTYNSAEGWRDHFMGSLSHNVILVDGKEQVVGERIANMPLATDQYVLTPEYDYARGSFADGFNGIEGQAVHTRAALYLRGRYWVVVDRIATDRPRTIEPLWHFHPDCAVTVDGNSVTAEQAGVRFSVIPVSNLNWDVEIVKGQTEPRKMGWHSVEYGVKVPYPVAVYSASIPGEAVFAWLLVPSTDATAKVEAQLVDCSADQISVQITSPGEASMLMTIPLDQGLPQVGAATSPP